MAITADITTAQQLLDAQNLGPCELVCGRLAMLPYTPWREGLVASHILGHLSGFVKRSELGVVVGGRTGFRSAMIPTRFALPTQHSFGPNVCRAKARRAIIKVRLTQGDCAMLGNMG